MQYFRSFVVSIALVLLAASPALAQGENAEAQQKFTEGRAAMGRGDYRAALELFRQSRAIEPGRGVLVNQALCEEALGQLATAQKHFREVVPLLTPDDDRAALVRDHLESLRLRVPALRLAGAAKPPGAVLLLDDQPISDEQFAGPIALDPGPHVVLARAPGLPEQRYRVELVAGRTSPLSIDWSAAPAPPAATATSTSHTRRTAAIVVGGVGVAALSVGAVTGVMALHDHAEIEKQCPARTGCPVSVTNTANTGQTLSVVSTVAFVAGAAGVGAGIYLLLTDKVTTAPVALGGGATVGGARGWVTVGF